MSGDSQITNYKNLRKSKLSICLFKFFVFDTHGGREREDEEEEEKQ